MWRCATGSKHGVREMIRGGIADGAFAPQNVDLAGITILGAINWIPEVVPARWADVLGRDRRQNRRPVDPVAASMSSASMSSEPLKVGEMFEGPSKTLTDAHFLLFSGLTGDVHPIHYDVEYARQTRFGKPLGAWPAHGRHDCAWRLERPRAHRGLRVRRTRLQLSQAGRRRRHDPSPLHRRENLAGRRTPLSAGSRRQSSTSAAKPCSKASMLYRVLRHEAPKEKS